MVIKPFNGDLTAWTAFWESYRSAIHDNTALSEIDKFNYLKSLLTRGALEAVSGLALTAANYREAVDTLQKRFGNKQQIISRHMDTLLNVEAVTSQNNLRGLRHLYDLIESNVRSLKSLGVASESYGTLLSSVLMNKLPSELRLIVSREIGESNWELDPLLKAVECEIRARERTALKPPSDSKHPVKDSPSALTFLTGNRSGQSCYYCQQAHPSTTCEVVTGVDARLRILCKAGRCYVCLRKGHVSRDCRTGIKCSTCKGRLM